MGLQPGSILGDYEVISVVQAGLMGELYTANDLEGGGSVTIMPLKVDVEAEPEKGKRLLEQATAAASLLHPNIATLFDVAEGPEGAEGLYAIYEHVEGTRLRALLGQRRLSPRASVGLAVELADALAEAHGAGIVHGRLTLDSVVVSQKGGAKVLGFGLTLPEGREYQDEDDVMALGGMLFEMLYGRPARGVTAQPTPSPGHASRADADAEIPAELNGIVSRMLAGGEGSGSAGALAAELRAVAAILDVRGAPKKASAERGLFGGRFRRPS